MELMSRLDVSQLGSREVEISVVTALQEVTRHQRTLRDVLARLQRRQNREEVSQLLDTEQEMEEGELTLPWQPRLAHVCTAYSLSGLTLYLMKRKI